MDEYGGEYGGNFEREGREGYAKDAKEDMKVFKTFLSSGFL